ncbi:hypothetical protein G8S55_06775 [Clostridium botulinum C]|uniref:hypothetical protein n=1 Tax=Clostridium botulinum TaxID=1491 RepID=UPI001E4CA27F|nr:hypothetical protein [Clostridium botulinum]MCD3216956.1 hypothetical protein [Clostridium botulinum C]
MSNFIKPILRVCSFCNKPSSNTMTLSQVNNEIYEDDNRLVCHNCIDECQMCHDEFLINDLSNINGNLYCNEHNEDLDMDDEEREGWDDYIEYINN